MGGQKDPGLAFSKLYQGSSQIVLIILVIIVGVSYLLNGTAPEGLLDFAKWVIGGASATGVAYMIKSGMENKAKIEHQDDGPDNPQPPAEDGNQTDWQDPGGYDI